MFVVAVLAMSMDFCCELEKIPNLIEHYAEHKAVDGDSFWQFLVEDYIDHGEGENHHNENDHDDLPFHGSHQCHHSNVLVSLVLSFSIDLDMLLVDPTISTYQFAYSTIYMETPFQPPQV